MASGVMQAVGNKMKWLQGASGNLAKDGFGKIARAGQSMVTGLAIGIPLLGGAMMGLGVNAISTAGKYETLKVALETSLGSQQAAAEGFAKITDFAAKTPFQLDEVTGAFIKLKNMGLDNSEKALTSYGDTASAMGKDLNQMVEAVADAATGEFERLKEFGIRSSSQGDKVSFTFKGVTTTVKKESKAIEDYLIKLGQTNFAGGMDKQSQTLQGKLSTLKDTFDLTMAAFADDTGLSDWAKGAIDSASKLMGGIKPLYDLLVKGDYTGGLETAFGWAEDSEIIGKILDIRNALKEVYDLVVSGGENAMDGGMWIDNLFGQGSAKILTDFINKMEEVGKSFQDFLGKPKVMESILVGLAGVIGTTVVLALGKMAIAVVLATWPFVLLGLTIAGLYYAWNTNFGGMRDTLTNFWAMIQPILMGLWNMFMTMLWPAILELGTALMNLWNVIAPYLIPILQFLGVVIGVVIIGAVVALIGIFTFLAQVFTATANMISEKVVFLQNMWNGLVNTANNVKNGVVNAFNGISSGVGNAMRGAANGIIDNVNRGIRSINWMAEAVNNIPGVNIPRIPEIPRFAQGGIVGGNSKTGDKILARVNSGELILNEKQQRNLDNQLDSKEGNTNNETNQTVIIHINLPSNPTFINSQSMAEFFKQAKQIAQQQGFKVA
jgi:hypothetical protein